MSDTICFPPLLTILVAAKLLCTVHSCLLPAFSVKEPLVPALVNHQERRGTCVCIFQRQVVLRECSTSDMQATCVKAVLTLNFVACKYCLICSCSSFIENTITCFTLASLKSERGNKAMLYIHPY